MEQTSGIYKVVFNNDKMYIGYTNNLSRRMTEHTNKDVKEHPELLFSRAYLKYGIKKVELIEYIEPTNRQLMTEREQYWIAYYNTYLDREKGYNMTKGGDGLVSAGVENMASYLSQEDVDLIYDKLLNTNLTYLEIIDLLENCSISIVRNINMGRHYVKEGYHYPLREKRLDRVGFENKTSAFYQNKDKLLEIVKDLKNTQMSYDELSKKYNISSSTIGLINRGEKYSLENEKYPLRTKNQNRKRIFTEKEMFFIYDELHNKNNTISSVAKTLGCDKKVISDINCGKRQRQSNLEYPFK